MQDDYSEVFKIPLKKFKDMTDWQKLGLDESKIAKAKQREAVKSAHQKLTHHGLFDPPEGSSEQELAEYLALIKKAAESLLKKLPPPLRAEPIPEDKKKDLISDRKKASAPFSFSNSGVSAVVQFPGNQLPKSTVPTISNGGKINVSIDFYTAPEQRKIGISSLIHALQGEPYSQSPQKIADFVIENFDHYRCCIAASMKDENRRNQFSPQHADIRIIAYDCTNEESFRYADTLLSEWKEEREKKEQAYADELLSEKGKKESGSSHPPKPYRVILVSTKNDATNERWVDSTRGAESAKHYGIPFIKTSARNNSGIDALRSVIIKELDEFHAPKADAKGSAEPHNAGDGSSSKCAIL